MWNRRRETGAVPGGLPTRHIPASPVQVDLAAGHAIGRAQAMAEMMLHVAYLKSAELAPTRPNALSYTGARFQDFRGGKDADERVSYVMAHRSIMGVSIDRFNVATLPRVRARRRLQQALIAPQARTDPLLPMANYADRLLEIVACEPTLELFQKVYDRQKPGRPVEANLIVDFTYKLMDVLAESYDRAADKNIQLLRKKGILESRIGDPLPKPPRGRATDAFEELLEEARREGPSSDIVDKRFAELKDAFKLNPSEFADFPRTYLNVSRAVSQGTQPTTVHRDKVAETVETLAEAKADTSRSSDG